MIRVLEELARIIAYGGGGGVLGYAICSWVNDQHRLTTSILGEAEYDMPTRRRFLSPNALQGLVAILVMMALLLTGLAWLRADQLKAEQDRRDCETLAEVAKTLQGRTANYREAAKAERQLWRDLYRELKESGATGPVMGSVKNYLDAQELYLEHLRSNPYPRDAEEDC